MPDKIKKITALEILDSRGNPTVEATVELSNGMQAKAAVPSGASTGRFEAHELRDGDPHRYAGKGVLRAVENIEGKINKELNGLRATDQQKVDQHLINLDGTKNKAKLGANAILAVSLATARVASKYAGLPLYEYLRHIYDPKLKNYKMPTPVVNVVNGGAHGDTNLNIQEFWLVPHGQETFMEKLRMASEIFHLLGESMHHVGLDTDLGNEGGYSPHAKSHKQIFELLMHSVQAAGYQPVHDILFGIDAGASEFYDADKGQYLLDLEKAKLGAHDLAEFYFDLMELYPLRFIEDPFDQEDWAAWKEFFSDHMIKDFDARVIGDDLFVTNVQRLQKGIEKNVANGIIIKPNQIGTLSETLDTIRLAKQNHIDVIVSHRSGETADTTIADLAVAVNAEYIKTGSTSRGERIVKYNRLLSIEQALKNAQK